MRFPGDRGHELAGLLDLPAGRPPLRYALVAHCFTCGKDLKALYRMGKRLAEHGVGCLRFDFAGLGDSEGDFEHTDLATNRDDLRAAASFLEEEYRAPRLLIGHSLGGIAALVAAPVISTIRAVVLIAAPSELTHLERQFPEIEQAAQRGTPESITVAGRTYTIGPGFLAALKRLDVTRAVKALSLPLLILHAPKDEVVAHRHAEALYRWADQPKSLVALDGADHTLSRTGDAHYAADLIAAWSTPYTL